METRKEKKKALRQKVIEVLFLMNIIFSCFKVTSNPKCLVKEYYFHLDINLCVLIQELFLYFWIANSFESSSSISGLTLALF